MLRSTTVSFPFFSRDSQSTLPFCSLLSQRHWSLWISHSCQEAFACVAAGYKVDKVCPPLTIQPHFKLPDLKQENYFSEKLGYNRSPHLTCSEIFPANSKCFINRFKDEMHFNSHYIHTGKYRDCQVFLCFRWEVNWYFFKYSLFIFSSKFQQLTVVPPALAFWTPIRY